MYISGKRNSNKKAKLSFDSDEDSQPIPSPKKVSKPDSKRQLISDDSEEEDTEPTPKESGKDWRYVLCFSYQMQSYFLLMCFSATCRLYRILLEKNACNCLFSMNAQI